MNKQQELLLQMLVEIDEICTANGLNYYLGGGCLIGALRHRGFLPWDDDADIHLTRADALKLREIAISGGLPRNRVLVTPEEYDSGIPYYRYVNTETTTLLRSSYYANDVPRCLMVDIFILDPAPDDPQEQKRFLSNAKLCMYTNDFAYWSKGSDIAELKRWAAWQRIAGVFGRRRVGHHLSKRLLSYNDDSSEYVFIRSEVLPATAPQACIVPRSWFGEPKRVPYETTTLCIPAQAGSLNACAHGTSWVDIPTSVGIRRTAHTIYTDVFFSNSSTIKDLKSIADLRLTRFLNAREKSAVFAHAPNRNIVQYNTLKCEAELAGKTINNKWEEAGISLDDIENSRKLEALEPVFRNYYAMLTWPRFTYWDLDVPICDDAFWAAWYPVFQNGNYQRVLKAIKRRYRGGLIASSARLQKLVEDCIDADFLMDALWSNVDDEVAIAIAQLHESDERLSIVFMRGILAAEIRASNDQTDYCALRVLAERYLSQFPYDGELSYWHGLILLKLGDEMKAKSALMRAADYSVNGIVRLMAQDVLANQ